MQIQLCKFHTSKTFKERSCKESPKVKEILKKLRETDSEEDFQKLVEELKENASSTFFTYFDVKWLQCPEAWAQKDKKFSVNHGNSTTNRLEVHNSKIKMVSPSNPLSTGCPESHATRSFAVVFLVLIAQVAEIYFWIAKGPPHSGKFYRLKISGLKLKWHLLF